MACESPQEEYINEGLEAEKDLGQLSTHLIVCWLNLGATSVLTA